MNALPRNHESPSIARVEPSAARSRADLVYQSVTIAAILLVLGSLWIF
jgi:hypothetical protein